MVMDNCDAIATAVKADLGRPTYEGLIGDVSGLTDQVRYNLAHIRTWSKTSQVGHPLPLKPGHSEIRKEPKGVALIIGAWNFPFGVTVGPLIEAITAGCACIVKPSEVSPNCAKLMQELIKKYLDQNFYRVVLGAVPETTILLNLPFDHFFYTGNGTVAKIIMKAAAQHLASVSLELGGKSPVIVEKDADLAVSAKRILHGKSLNCGQICLAPDYILCHEDVLKPFIENLKKAIKQMHGDDVEKSQSYGRIINQLHWDRITNLIKTSNGEVVFGGLEKANRERKFIPPTVILNPDASSPILREEVFGPAISVMSYKTLDDAVKFIKRQEIPLGLYIFSNDQSKVDYLLTHIRSGGVCVNDCIFHYSNLNLPFGGLGPSGQGKYHGVSGFDEFSHSRAVMYRPTYIDPSARYPPYSKSSEDAIKKFMIFPLFSKKTLLMFKLLKYAAIVGFGAILFKSKFGQSLVSHFTSKN